VGCEEEKAGWRVTSDGEGAPVAKEPVASVAGPAGALAPATTKGGPTEGCGHAVVVVPARAPVDAAVPTVCSREAATTM
jgi:hypothetical protein